MPSRNRHREQQKARLLKVVSKHTDHGNNRNLTVVPSYNNVVHQMHTAKAVSNPITEDTVQLFSPFLPIEIESDMHEDPPVFPRGNGKIVNTYAEPLTMRSCSFRNAKGDGSEPW